MKIKDISDIQKPQLIKKGRRKKCNMANYVPIVVPGLSTGSSISATPTSPTSVLQEAAISAQHPASTRSESTSGIERVRRDPLRQEFTENLVDQSVPAHGDAPASSSRESSSEPRGTVVSGASTVFIVTSRRTEIVRSVREPKITRGPCRKRTGTVVPRAGNVGDWITADHKVLSERCESRNNHRYAVVVQDLATQWIRSYPCRTKTSQETQRSLHNFLEPNRKPKVIYTDNSFEFGKACEDLSWNHCTSTPHRSETNGIAERAVRRVKEGTSAELLQLCLNESWWADSMECYTTKVLWLC